MLKAYLKILMRMGVRLFARLFFLFPIKKNRILFEAFQGKSYSGNPKYISEYLEEHYPGGYELVWTFLNEKSAPAGRKIRAVRMKSLRWYYYQATAGFIVSNFHPITVTPLRKGQIFIETWHAGGAYKRIGESVIGSSRGVRRLQKWSRELEQKKISLYLSSSDLFTKYNIVEAHDYYGPVLPCGMPRNDILMDERKREEVRERVRKSLGIKGAVVLYAPTWRGEVLVNNTKLTTVLDFDALSKAIGNRYGEGAILVRSHYGDHNRYAGSANVLDVSDYPDMQELLCAADILITDYSSSIWDFALIGKPCYLYVPDLKEYGDQTRGFFVPIKEWPGKICESMEELTTAIETMDDEEHRRKAEEHLAAFGSYEKGNASEQVAEYIRSH